MDQAIELAMELIRCKSVSPDDAGCMNIIAEQLEPCEFDIEWLNFNDTKNIWLRRGVEPPLFVFLGHTDVVPPGPLELWQSQPFEPEIRGDYLFGRGAADMKSSVAAMVIACQAFLKQHPVHRGSIALLLTSDEEALAADGIVKVMEVFKARGENIDWCLVGEPSSEDSFGDTIKIGRRGSLCGKLRIIGTQGHVAYPQFANNPVHLFAPALTSLTQAKWDSGNDHFPPTSFQISNLAAGSGAENVIPSHADVMFNFRFSPEMDEDSIKERVHSMLDTFDFRYELHWRLSGKPFYTESKELTNAVMKAVHDTIQRYPKPSTAGGTSDGRFIAPTGAQVVELGPVNTTIHRINECVDVHDVERMCLAYRKVLETLLIDATPRQNDQQFN